MSLKIDKKTAKNIWIDAQKLNEPAPFGKKAQAVTRAVEQLGYVQIDTINVIERCHHHILYNRIPDYERSYLHQAQNTDKTVFEYWTHALSYVPTSHFKYFVKQMKNINTAEGSWFGQVTKSDYQKVMRILKQGPVSIRDIKDDELKEKRHEWDSRKPSKRALQLGFYKGDFVISGRDGMLKNYDLTLRHFNWKAKPAAVTKTDYDNYILDRALRAQGVVSLESICHLDPKQKPATLKIIQQRVKKKELIEVQIQNVERNLHWVRPETLEKKPQAGDLTHILSPFDPLIIQRKRLKNFFDYEHVFEAYIPKAKRKFGYFTLPVLSGHNIIALLDLKTARDEGKLLVQNWIWREKYKSTTNKKIIEHELHRFEKFQLGVKF